MRGLDGGDRPARRETARKVLERDRIELQRAVRELRSAARSSVAPAARLAKHPYAWLLGTFAMGLWLGLRRARGREVEP